MKIGPEEDITGDPMTALQRELITHQYVKIPEVPTFTGGAIGYVAFDSIHHFEPKTARYLPDNIGIPEAVFMLVDTLLICVPTSEHMKVRVTQVD